MTSINTASIAINHIPANADSANTGSANADRLFLESEFARSFPTAGSYVSGGFGHANDTAGSYVSSIVTPDGPRGSYVGDAYSALSVSGSYVSAPVIR